MTGIRQETQIKVNLIEEAVLSGFILEDIGEQLKITKAAVSFLIKEYLPHLKKSNRKAIRSTRVPQTDLEKAQHSRFQRKRVNARCTGFEWDLIFQDVIWPTHCPILGLELDYFAESRKENSVSFDRTDPHKGYIKGNVQIISWRANRIKNDGTEEEHRKIADYLRGRTCSLSEHV